MTIVCVGLYCALAGCSLFGGASTTTKPETVSKLETELEAAKKSLDESIKQYENIEGGVTAVEQKIDILHNEIKITNETLSIVSTNNTQNNESIKSLLWTIAGIYLGLKVFQLLRALLIAKLAPGSTFKQLLIKKE